MPFTPLKIVGMDDKVVPSREPNSALVTVTLFLSERAPHEWQNYFNQAWQQHIYMLKRRANVVGKNINIHCVLEELEKDHLPELKKIVAATNEAYARHAEAQHAREQAEAARTAKIQQDVRDIKGRIKFD